MLRIRSISIVLLTVLLTVGGRVWAQAYGVQWIADPEFANALVASSEVLPRPIHMRYVYQTNFDGFKSALKDISQKTLGAEADVFLDIISHGRPGYLQTAYIQPMNGIAYPGPGITYSEIAQAIVDLANSNHDLTVNVNLIACYSGSFLPILKKTLEEGSPSEKKKPGLLRRFLKAPTKPKINVIVSTDEATPSENGWGIVTLLTLKLAKPICKSNA